MNHYFVTNLNPKGPGSLSYGMQWKSDEKRIIHFEVAGTINFPEDSYLGFYSSKSPYENPAAWTSRNIEVQAHAAPGHVIITGSPVWMDNCIDVTINGLSFILDAPSNDKLANFWGPLRVTSSGPGRSHNLNFINCALIGGEDEVAVCPNGVWPAASSTDAYHSNINFEGCFFGYGTTKWRGNHNHAIAATFVDKFVFNGNFIAHENRRCPQVDGNSTITNNVIYNYGTMGIGFYKGNHNVKNNMFIRGPQSRDKPIVYLLQVAESDRTGLVVVSNEANKLVKINNNGGLPTFEIDESNSKTENRNLKVQLRETFTKDYGGNKLPFSTMFTAGPKVNGQELPQIKRARQEALTGTGSWVKTLKESNLL